MREQLFTGKDEEPIKRTQAKEQLFTEKERSKDREERLGGETGTEKGDRGIPSISTPSLF